MEDLLLLSTPICIASVIVALVVVYALHLVQRNEQLQTEKSRLNHMIGACLFGAALCYTTLSNRDDKQDDRNQLNPNNPKYRGATRIDETDDTNDNRPLRHTMTKAELDNHADLLNPNNPKYQGPVSKR